MCVEKNITQKNRKVLLSEANRELKALKMKVSPQVIRILQTSRIYGLKDYRVNTKGLEKDMDASGGVYFDHSHASKLAKMNLPLNWLNSVVLKNVGNIANRMKKGGFFEGVLSHELTHGYMMNFLNGRQNNKFVQAAYKNAR